MSKIIDKIEVVQYPQMKRAVVDKFFDSCIHVEDNFEKDVFSTSAFANIQSKYSIKVTFGQHVWINDIKELDYHLKNVKRNVVEAIYGEFRQPLYELHHRLNERDYIKATETLDKIIKEMFECY